MARYNLERCSVFLVEDNRYMRNVLEDMLRHFRFGRVATAGNGAEAIDFLKTLHEQPQMLGTSGLDIIVSDLLMTPMNGLLLLRWVRAAKESPNRFIPFIMLSGAADHEYVKAARDIGTTEFLAKPFSVQAVYRHILEVIDHPRQFVTTHNYFGPDRRRKSLSLPPNVDGDRREMKEDNVTIVYSATKVVKPQGRTDVWYWRLPNALKQKVGGVGLERGEVGEFPGDLLAEAEEQLQRSALDFNNWALDYLGQLSNLCTEAVLKPGRRNKQFEEIHLLAHELRGQGGIFGFPLISIFGKMLYDITGERCREDDHAVEIVKAHIDTMRVVLRENIRGDGGGVGRELHKALKQAIEKHSVVE